MYVYVGCVYSVCLSGGVWQRQGKWMGEEVYASLFVLCAWIIVVLCTYDANAAGRFRRLR